MHCRDYPPAVTWKPYEGGALYSEIDLFLRQNGFGLYDMYKPIHGPNGLLMWANAIFVNVQRPDL